jgi:predicted phosphoribosyltransferase
MQLFKNRREAGRRLAQSLAGYVGRNAAIVLALPRGGVPVGYEVARTLGAPLDVFLVRKLGTPGREELAMGAIAPAGCRVLNRDVVEMMGVSEEDIRQEEKKERTELDRRIRAYRGDRPEPALSGKTVLLVDDGLATGASMEAAVQAVRSASPARIVVAVPVAPPDSVHRLKSQADEVLSLITPQRFSAVGAWYENFEQTTDEEVRRLLGQAWSA